MAKSNYLVQFDRLPIDLQRRFAHVKQKFDGVDYIDLSDIYEYPHGSLKEDQQTTNSYRSLHICNYPSSSVRRFAALTLPQFAYEQSGDLTGVVNGTFPYDSVLQYSRITGIHIVPKTTEGNFLNELSPYNYAIIRYSNDFKKLPESMPQNIKDKIADNYFLKVDWRCLEENPQSVSGYSRYVYTSVYSGDKVWSDVDQSVSSSWNDAKWWSTLPSVFNLMVGAAGGGGCEAYSVFDVPWGYAGGSGACYINQIDLSKLLGAMSNRKGGSINPAWTSNTVKLSWAEDKDNFIIILMGRAGPAHYTDPSSGWTTWREPLPTYIFTHKDVVEYVNRELNGIWPWDRGIVAYLEGAGLGGSSYPDIISLLDSGEIKSIKLEAGNNANSIGAGEGGKPLINGDCWLIKDLSIINYSGEGLNGFNGNYSNGTNSSKQQQKVITSNDDTYLILPEATIEWSASSKEYHTVGGIGAIFPESGKGGNGGAYGRYTPTSGGDPWVVLKY